MNVQNANIMRALRFHARAFEWMSKANSQPFSQRHLHCPLRKHCYASLILMDDL